jgi:hypothetical protein
MSRPKVMVWLILFTLGLALTVHVLLPWIAGTL